MIQCAHLQVSAGARFFVTTVIVRDTGRVRDTAALPIQECRMWVFDV